MSWLAVRLVLGGALKRLSGAAGALLGLIARHPWPAAVLALLCLSGGLWWHYGGKVAALDAKLMAANGTIDAMIDAQLEAKAAALAQKQRIEAHYAAIAQQKDREHEEDLADARAAAQRYIDAHRVRPQGDAGAGSGTAAAAGDQLAGFPQGLPADTVLVSAEDVHACTDAVSYAFGARNFVIDLVKASAAPQR